MAARGVAGQIFFAEIRFRLDEPRDMARPVGPFDDEVAAEQVARYIDCRAKIEGAR